ncbi:MAG TPA: hypothetical protein VF166_07330 [Gemmatimonadaceae bacterium]
MTFTTFGRQHPVFVVVFVVLILALLGADGWVLTRRARYADEVARLQAGMSDFERKKSETILDSRERRFDMMMQLIRRQAKVDKEIHLSVSVDSGRMYLEREGALLREIPVEVGPEARIGTLPDTIQLVPPRGARSVQALFTADSGWVVPRWVYRDRGLPIPSDRMVQGGLGPVAIVLDGGTIIYSLPSVGPLNDPSYVLPGAVRASAADLQAIVPDLSVGTSVYFY